MQATIAAGLGLVLGCAVGAEEGSQFGTAYSSGGGAQDDGDDDGHDPGPDDGVESGPVEDDGADDGAPADGDCCVGHEGAGCGDPGIAACVCKEDAFCCDSKWDDLCASLVEEHGCGLCDAPTDDGGATGVVEDGGGVDDGGETTDGGGVDDGGGPTDDGGGVDDGAGPTDDGGGVDDGGAVGVGDCCSLQEGTGCEDAMIQDCVCAQDDYCCVTQWDDVCVGEVVAFECGVCEGVGSTDDGAATDDGGMIDPGNCCTVHPEVGCSAPDIEACVCASDDYCCLTEWDDICVGEVDSFGCGAC